MSYSTVHVLGALYCGHHGYCLRSEIAGGSNLSPLPAPTLLLGMPAETAISFHSKEFCP